MLLLGTLSFSFFTLAVVVVVVVGNCHIWMMCVSVCTITYRSFFVSLASLSTSVFLPSFVFFLSSFLLLRQSALLFFCSKSILFYPIPIRKENSLFSFIFLFTLFFCSLYSKCSCACRSESILAAFLHHLSKSFVLSRVRA